MNAHNLGKRTSKYLVPLFILLALFIILAASLGSANLSLKETAIIIAKYIPGINYFIDLAQHKPSKPENNNSD